MNYTLKSVLSDHIDKDDDYLYVVNPDHQLLATLNQILSESSESGVQEIRIVADESKIANPLGDFKIATRIAALVEREECKIRTLNDYDRTKLIGSSSGVSFWTYTPKDSFATFQPTDSESAEVMESVREEWETASEYKLRTPGLPRLRETMREKLGDECQTTFDTLLDEFEEIRGSGDGFNEVSMSIIAAARNELLFYDLSRWGEDIGLASKATFTRKKQVLEDADIIETSKVRIEVGRPRQRLHIKGSDSDIKSLVQQFV